MKKTDQDGRLLWKLPVCHVGHFWPLLTFLTAPLKSSLSLIGFKRYPDIWEVQHNLSISHNLKKKSVKTAISFENHLFGCFWSFWTFLTASVKSSLSAIGSKRYPEGQRCQNTVIIYPNLKKMHKMPAHVFVLFPIKFLSSLKMVDARSSTSWGPIDLKFLPLMPIIARNSINWMAQSESTKCVVENPSSVHGQW